MLMDTPTTTLIPSVQRAFLEITVVRVEAVCADVVAERVAEPAESLVEVLSFSGRSGP